MLPAGGLRHLSTANCVPLRAAACKMVRMKSIHTTPGRLYALASSTDCSVATPEDQILGTCQAGQQLIFAATHAELSLSDDAALAVPVCDKATFLLNPVPGKRGVFAPVGTADDVILLSEDNTVATFQWPNRLICDTNSELGIPSTVQSITGDAPQLIYANNMFYHQGGAFEFSVNLPELRYAREMFDGASITRFESDLSHLKDAYYMFMDSKLEEIHANFDQVQNAQRMFAGCPLVDVELDLPKAKYITGILYLCTSLKTVKLRAPLVTNIDSALYITTAESVELSLARLNAPYQVLSANGQLTDLRLSVPSLETIDFQFSKMGDVPALEELRFFADTDADGVMHEGAEKAKTIKFYATHTALSAASVQHIVDTVTDWSTSTGVSALLQIPTGKLTEEQKATLAAKGWTYTEV